MTSSPESPIAEDRDVKPRLVLFRWAKPGLPGFVHQHLREQVRCLEHHFDVVLVDEDCDYEQVCDEHRPDLAVFESGVYAGPRKISRTDACPEIPKVGFCNADAYCVTRSVFLSDMERWGVETFFTLAVSMAEYTPDIADRLFGWPNFVDGDVYRDHGLQKNIPVLFTGSQAPHYPWRSRIHSIVTQQYPCLTMPHAGWFDAKAAGRMVHGAGYAELLNAAWVVPACGTIAKDVIRKHFEVPASRTCLVTERTASLEAAGFVDMENVVFADQDDILEKLEFLFSHPDELRRITDSGYELVHARHTMAQRDQFLQWLRLHRAARPGERIIQTSPFEPLQLVPAASGATNSHPISGGLDRVLLREGERLLEIGRLEDAEDLFLRCLNYHFMPEPVMGLTRRHLYGGNAREAMTWVTKPIERVLVHHGPEDADPVEWAFFIRSLLCQGDLTAAVRRADQFPALRHVELNRIRRVTYALAGREAAPGDEAGEDRAGRRSVHVLAPTDMATWTADLCVMLRACGQDRVAVAVTEGHPLLAGRSAGLGASLVDRSKRRRRPDQIRPLMAERPQVRLRRRLTREWNARRRPAIVGTPQAVVQSLVQKEDVRDALLIRASVTARSTRAVLAGLTSNPNRPKILWLNDATPALLPRRTLGPGERVSLNEVMLRAPERDARPFDVVVVGRSAGLAPEEQEMVGAARFVVLTGINRAPAHRIHSELIEDHDYALVTHHASHDGGYSLFRRLRSAA